MKCATCGKTTKVLETRSAFGDCVTRRVLKCLANHVTSTYEISSAMWTSAKFAIKKSIKGQAYNHKIENLRKQKVLMFAERLAGATCIELAAKYKMSVHMARYYTRLPRHKLYPGVKKNVQHPTV